MSDSSFRVVVAGGGVAGLEALLALRELAGDRIESTLVCPEPEFVYRPMAVAEPFGRGQAAHHRLADIAHDLGVDLVPEALAEVAGDRRAAITASGRELSYDALLVAVGARSEPAFQRTLTWTPERDAEVFGGLLADLDEGYSKTVAFVVPPGVAWALPGYELALMTAWQAWGMGQEDVAVTVYTHEDAPLGLFGARATATLRHELEEAGVAVQAGVYVVEEREHPGRLRLQPGDRPLEAQRIVALPRAAGRAIPGVPADERGFVPTDLHGAVAGLDRVWAAGDAMTFPVKQGGLAAQQADAAAESIAAAAGASVEPQPFRPVLRGVMLTGRGAQWMHHDPSAGVAGEATRHSLWWPPTKIAGRYLSPYLAARDGTGVVEDVEPPGGEPLELDLGRDVPVAADALTQAGLRGEAQSRRFARRRAEARALAESRAPER